MTDDELLFPRDDAERAWLAALPTASAPSPGAEDGLVRSLRAAGMLRPRPGFAAIALRLAAAIVIFLAGAAAGTFGAARTRRAPPRLADSAGPARVVASVTPDSAASGGQHIIAWY